MYELDIKIFVVSVDSSSTKMQNQIHQRIFKETIIQLL